MSIAAIGRPRTCDCGECAKCKHRAYMRGWWARQSDARKREYLDKRGPERRTGRRSNTQLPEIVRRAHWTVHNAIRDGRLTRLPCEVCGAEPTDAHHDDYERPLDVRWLCRKHHGEQHRKYESEPAAS